MTGLGLASSRKDLPPLRDREGSFRVQRRQFRDVGAGDERPSCSRHDDTIDVACRDQRADRPIELVDGGAVEGVELVGTMDRERADTVSDGETQVLVGHSEYRAVRRRRGQWRAEGHSRWP
jgi:hypothetical protein